MAYFISISQVFVIKWFQSYLSNRNFFVTLENVFSDAGLINCGVLEGFTLRPLLFLIYINDLPQALNATGWCFYADDACIFYQDKDVEKIEKVLNKEILSLCEWFINKKLSIHFRDDKAKAIFFLSNEKPTKAKHIIWRLLSKKHDTVEYLRCYLDFNLNGGSMTRRVLNPILSYRIQYHNHYICIYLHF